MNKVYFIAPLLLLVVFSGFYTVHHNGLKAREDVGPEELRDRVPGVDDPFLPRLHLVVRFACEPLEGYPPNLGTRRTGRKPRSSACR
jgi:hypothetical protein